MRKRTCLWTGIAGVVAGLAGSCGGTFVCTDDSNCNLSSGGRCIDGACDYSPGGSTSTATGEPPTASGEPATADTTAPTSGATVATTTDATTGQPSTSSGDPTTATTTDATTGEPVNCKDWEKVLPEAGKATGVVLLADGGAVVVGVRDAVQPEVLAKRLSADGSEMMWETSIAPTDDPGLLEDIDVVARVFQPDPVNALVVYSIRGVDGDMKYKHGPYLAGVAVEDGEVLPHEDLFAPTMNRSLRGAMMPVPGTMLLAGQEDNKVWYDRVDFQNGVLEKVWTAEIEPLDANSMMENPERAQAIVALSDAAVVGGTWEPEDNAKFRAWLRSVKYMSGEEVCTCTLDDAGILALAPTNDGELFVGGFVQAATQAELWLARMPSTCPLNCSTFVWQDRLSGSEPFTEYNYAERVHDSVHALYPLAGGGVVAGGTLDNKPWLARYSDDGTPVWQMEPSPMAELGAVLAIAVSDVDGCVTVAGSENYLKGVNMRKWWIRRLTLE